MENRTFSWVPCRAPLLHADALRTTYGRALRYGLDPTKYMRPQETWGRVPVKILCGDFYQLPPVPSSASLLAPHSGQSYEHQQGRKLLADFEYVVDFVQMQRLTDPLQLGVLNAMRTAGGKHFSEESLQAIVITQVVTSSGSGQFASSINQADPQPQWDHRLRAARGWYESAYENARPGCHQKQCGDHRWISSVTRNHRWRTEHHPGYHQLQCRDQRSGIRQVLAVDTGLFYIDDAEHS